MNPFGKKSILVVEDDIDILNTLSMFLISEEFELLSAENGKVALVIILEHGPPDLILLDMKMPIMNGWDFSKEFYEKYDHQTPIIVTTAASDAEKWAKEIGADGWIAKPYSLADLLEKIKKWV